MEAANWRISREDQDNLNQFSRTIMRKHHVYDKLTSIKKERAGCEDALAELMLLDDPCWVSCGEFYELFDASESATTRVEQIEKQVGEQCATYEKEVQDLDEDLQNINSKLKNTLGERVNLEAKTDYVALERK